MKIAVVIGTRPEIIKISPVIAALQKAGLEFFTLHAGQHYSYELDGVLFKQFCLLLPKYNLKVGSHLMGKQTAMMIEGIETVLMDELPDLVLVLGDTNTVFAGAFVAAKLHIKVGHIEAGLRSYDRNMPEEINRMLVDHCSDLLFAPTENAQGILLNEGISLSQVFMTGNTIVDAVYANLKLAEQAEIVVSPQQYFLATIHRTENVDNCSRFASVLYSLRKVSDVFQLPVVYPAHPHSLNKAKEFGLDFGDIDVIPPADYFSFLKLEKNAKAILTDSGGVQEEACILGVPCVTLRDNTERPETIEIGSNVLAGVRPDKVLECLEMMLRKDNHWSNPFGDGKAGERIVEILKGNL